MRALLLLAVVGTARAEDATDAAARGSTVEIVERRVPETPRLRRTHFQSPVLAGAGIVVAAGSTTAGVAAAVAGASGDPVWQGLGPFVVIAAAGVLTGGITMIFVGLSQVPY